MKTVIAAESDVSISTDENVVLQGSLTLPPNAHGMILFAHGSGSSRHSPRNRYVAGMLQNDGFGTLLMDLLTYEEEESELRTRHLRFNIPLLARRLSAAATWVSNAERTSGLAIGYFGASTGAAAALLAASGSRAPICAVVSRGGRPDLAGDHLPLVRSPTLLIVGGDDGPVIGLNREALGLLRCEKRLEIIPGATHLFEEPGALESVAHLASDWFLNHCVPGEIALPS
ncbi:MAG: dienelactone hydrolase family protein [Gammaproteobacteria bacterium]